MAVREFLNSGIDSSYNDRIILEWERIPFKTIEVEIPEDLKGFSDNARASCEWCFESYLDYSLKTLYANKFGELILSLF